MRFQTLALFFWYFWPLLFFLCTFFLPPDNKGFPLPRIFRRFLGPILHKDRLPGNLSQFVDLADIPSTLGSGEKVKRANFNPGREKIKASVSGNAWRKASPRSRKCVLCFKGLLDRSQPPVLAHFPGPLCRNFTHACSGIELILTCVLRMRGFSVKGARFLAGLRLRTKIR